jgi:hypothetical protein
MRFASVECPHWANSRRLCVHISLFLLSLPLLLACSVSQGSGTEGVIFLRYFWGVFASWMIGLQLEVCVQALGGKGRAFKVLASWSCLVFRALNEAVGLSRLFRDLLFLDGSTIYRIKLYH